MLRLIAAIAIMAWAPSAWAETLYRCGASEGMSRFLSGSLVTPEEGGWEEDGISQGQFLLTLTGNQYDVVFLDTIGLRSSVGDGAIVLGYPTTEGHVAVVYFNDSVETYLFDKASGSVGWTQIKHNGVINKVAAFVAPCS